MERKQLKEVITAIEGSVAKWQAIVDGTGEDRGPQNCPLCRMFLLAPNGGWKADRTLECVGCPVYLKTKKRYCRDTPYITYVDEVEIEGLEAAAQEELKFLRLILEEWTLVLNASG